MTYSLFLTKVPILPETYFFNKGWDLKGNLGFP